MLETKKLAKTLIFTLMVFLTAGLFNHVNANPESETLPVLAMPIEHIDYTITQFNGTLWAQVDGTYPLYLLQESDNDVFCIPNELPMVYPTPPGTTNIYISINETEINWSNWLYDTHHTAIGDWEMIYCVINPVSEYFLLTIHYEHPIKVVNGSNLFLYDLNLQDYLTSLSNTSVAYFTIRFETEVSNVRAYTTLTDSVWNPKSFTLRSEDRVKIVAIEMRSVLGQQLAGDLVVMFDDNSAQIPKEFPYWFIGVPVFLIVGSLVTIIYRRKCR